MDIVEINEHIRKLKCEETNWQSVEKLAALCTVRDELEEADPGIAARDLCGGVLHSSGTTKRLCGGCQLCSFRRSDAGARQTHERNKAGVPERV